MFFFRSSKSAFSRHDNVRASSTLFIWLNENVPSCLHKGLLMPCYARLASFYQQFAKSNAVWLKPDCKRTTCFKCKQAEERKVMPPAHLWFAYRHPGCVAFSTQSTNSFKNKTNNMPNKQAKSAQVSTTDWGLIWLFLLKKALKTLRLHLLLGLLSSSS